MTALADLKARIADEINRTDMTSQIALAISTAVKAYKSTRFAFNESTDTLVTVAGTAEYSTATVAPNDLPSDIIDIDTARITVNSNRYLLEPVTFETIDANDVSTTYTSRPIWYAWRAEALRLYPCPDAAYTIDLRYHADVAEETWCTRAEALIRARAKKELYLHALFDTASAQTMEMIEVQEKAALLREMRHKQTSGRVVPHD